MVALANVTAVVAVTSVHPLIGCHDMCGERVRLAFASRKGGYVTVGYWASYDAFLQLWTQPFRLERFWPNPKFSFSFSFPCCLMILILDGKLGLILHPNF
jgi:hypothetical protein